jgi:hypothetical protein
MGLFDNIVSNIQEPAESSEEPKATKAPENKDPNRPETKKTFRYSDDFVNFVNSRKKG